MKKQPKKQNKKKKEEKNSSEVKKEVLIIPEMHSDDKDRIENIIEETPSQSIRLNRQNITPSLESTPIKNFLKSPK